MMWEKVFAWVRGCLSLFAGMATYLYGNMNGLLIALFVSIVLDYATGIIKAGIKKELASEIGFKGILKKMLILMVVALAHLIDNCVGSGETWRNIAIVFYICNEGLSILENIIACGVPIPEKIKNALQAMQEDNEKEGDENGSKDSI